MISRFIQGLVRPYMVPADMEAAYRKMAQDSDREAEALEWAEATIGEVADATRRSFVRTTQSVCRGRSHAGHQAKE
jgi:hypothetical protein